MQKIEFRSKMSSHGVEITRKNSRKTAKNRPKIRAISKKAINMRKIKL